MTKYGVVVALAATTKAERKVQRSRVGKISHRVVSATARSRYIKSIVCFICHLQNLVVTPFTRRLFCNQYPRLKFPQQVDL